MEIPKNIQILICDDHSTSRKLAMKFLSALGFSNFTETESVRDAKQTLEERFKSQTPIQLILSDWSMPGETGIEFVKWIRGDERFNKLPFILITAQSSREEILEGIEAGASSYLVKPVTEELLREKLNFAWSHAMKIAG